MSESNIFDHILKTIWGIALLNIFFLVSLIFVAEYISGEEVLHDSIGPSKDIEEKTCPYDIKNPEYCKSPNL